MKFKFYIKHNEITNGPFSANEIYEKNLPDDTLIKEVHQEEWRKIKDYVLKMLVKFETLNKCKSDAEIKICLRSSLKKISFGTVDVQYSVSELLSEDEESTMEKLIANNKVICHYTLEDVIGQKINPYTIVNPKFCKLPSGFVVGVIEGDDVFPRFLDEVSPTNEKICFIICDVEKKDILIYLINPTQSSLYALGCNSNEIQLFTTQSYYFIEKVSCSYEYDITQVVKKICFGYDVKVLYPYNTMRPFGRTNAHNFGDTYGTDCLRYNLFKAFLSNKKEKNEHQNLILAVSLMKDQQWQKTYEYAKQIICELKRLFVFSQNNDVAFAKPIDSEYWGEEGVVLIHFLYNKLCRINQEYNSFVFDDITNSFYFWENLINETIRENYVCKEYSRNMRKIVFYLPDCFSDFSMKDIGVFMAQQLSIPSDELENLICDWEQFYENKSVSINFPDKPDPAFSNEREKLKYYLLEGKKIYIRCDNCNVATEAPIDCNFITIPRGKFS